jgi:hypothetical protein
VNAIHVFIAICFLLKLGRLQYSNNFESPFTISKTRNCSRGVSFSLAVKNLHHFYFLSTFFLDGAITISVITY